MAKPLTFLNKLFYPFSYLLVSTTSLIENRLIKKESNVNIDEISKALELTDQENDGKEGKILRSGKPEVLSKDEVVRKLYLGKNFIFRN